MTSLNEFGMNIVHALENDSKYYWEKYLMEFCHKIHIHSNGLRWCEINNTELHGQIVSTKYKDSAKDFELFAVKSVSDCWLFYVTDFIDPDSISQKESFFTSFTTFEELQDLLIRKLILHPTFRKIFL